MVSNFMQQRRIPWILDNSLKAQRALLIWQKFLYTTMKDPLILTNLKEVFGLKIGIVRLLEKRFLQERMR
jgi:hypothetical protein